MALLRPKVPFPTFVIKKKSRMQDFISIRKRSNLKIHFRDKSDINFLLSVTHTLQRLQLSDILLNMTLVYYTDGT